MVRVAVAYENFLGGQVSAVPPNDLNENQLALAENVFVTDRDFPGMIVKRKGRSVFFDDSVGTSPTKVHSFLKADETEHLIFLREDDPVTEYQLRERTGAATSTLLKSYTTTQEDRASIITFQTDFAIVHLKGELPDKYDGSGGAGGVTTINAPAGSTTGIIEGHKGRLFTPNASPANKLQFSAVNNESDWTTADDAGSLFARTPRITGLMSIGEAGLIVTGEFETTLLTGSGPSSFSQLELSNKVGCKDFRTMVSFGNFGLFLSDLGVVAVSAEGMDIISLAVDDEIRGMSDAVKRDSIAFKDDEFYVLCYDPSGGGGTDRAIIFDTRFGVWTKATNFQLSDGTEQRNGDVIVASSVLNGKLFKLNDGTTDDGIDITMTVDTMEWDFGRWFARKNLRASYVLADPPGSSFTVTVQPREDGANLGSSTSFDVDDEEKFLAFGGDVVGRAIQLRLTNSGTTDVIRIRSIIGIAEMYPAGEI